MTTVTAKNYYSLLGVDKNASEEEIRRAYRKLARKFHPDVNKDDPAAETRFKQINEAYDVLNDQKRRRDYDEFGDNWRHADQMRQQSHSSFRQPSDGRTGRSGSFRFFTDGHPEDFFFRDVFESAPPSVQRIDTQITLEEAFFGCTRLLSIATPDGGTRSLEIDIPRGIADGGKVRLSPEGVPPIELKVKVMPHHRFRREGDDLHVEAPVPLLDAVLGGTAEVRAMDGTVILTIPAGSQNARTFRLTDKGMYRLRSDERGDMYVKIKVVLPERLTSEQRELYEKLRALEQPDSA